jgi:hypothetical protein
MKIEELEAMVGKTVAHRGAAGFEGEKRYLVHAVIAKKDFGTRHGVGPAVVLVRMPHGTEVYRPAAKFTEEYEVVREEGETANAQHPTPNIQGPKGK